MPVSDSSKRHEKLCWIYGKMLEIRFFEEAAIETFNQKLWKGSLHACIGQEAIAAAIGAALEPEDYLISSHRGHGHVLAKGVTSRQLMAELFGKTTGVCEGFGGSMHSMDGNLRVYPHGLVGSGAYIAAGIGMAIKMQRKREVVISDFGDGAVNTGGCHEGMNMAAVYKVPALFVCENNGIGVSTRIEQVLPIHRVSDRAPAYGMPGLTIDGTDAVQLLETLEEYIARARAGEGPALIEATCWRWEGHTAWDTSRYRTEHENTEWTHHDPIPRLAEFLIQSGTLSSTEIDRINDEQRDLIHDAVEFAKMSPEPEFSREYIMRNLYTGAPR